MRGYKPTSFFIERYENGWQCTAKYGVLVGPVWQPKAVIVYGKLRFLTYIRSVFAARKKARAERD